MCMHVSPADDSHVAATNSLLRAPAFCAGCGEKLGEHYNVTFTQEQWEAFAIHDLSSRDFVKAGTHYYRPADTSFIFKQTIAGGGGGGWTAMHLAARNGHLDIVQVLRCVCSNSG